MAFSARAAQVLSLWTSYNGLGTGPLVQLQW